MNSGDLKTYKYVKISKLNFFTITMLSLHIMRSESKKYVRIKVKPKPVYMFPDWYAFETPKYVRQTY